MIVSIIVASTAWSGAIVASGVFREDLTINWRNMMWFSVSVGLLHAAVSGVF